MIISASRRTDLPAFYTPWLINRVRAGFCEVPNPFDARQVGRVSLLPDEVEALIFWTRNPRPLFPYLPELDQRGYRYYFQLTLLGYPRAIEAHNPPLERALASFIELSDRIGPARVIWRYDPIVLSEITGPDYHRAQFERLACRLRGHTRRVVISLLDLYPKIRRGLAQMAASGARLIPEAENASAVHPGVSLALASLLLDLAEIAADNQLEIVSCAEALDLKPYGIRPGNCIDAGLLNNLFGLEVPAVKDPGQRPACGCAVSKDIGMYNSCLFGCRYCYATSSFERARQHYHAHDPHSPRLY